MKAFQQCCRCRRPGSARLRAQTLERDLRCRRGKRRSPVVISKIRIGSLPSKRRKTLDDRKDHGKVRQVRRDGLRQRPRRIEDFARAFDEHGVTWSQYRSFRQVVEVDPDCSIGDPMFSMVEHSGAGATSSRVTPSICPSSSAFPPAARRGLAKTRLGESTAEILNEIGYSRGQIAQLHDDAVVASAA